MDLQMGVKIDVLVQSFQATFKTPVTRMEF